VTTASRWAFWHRPLGAERIYRRLAPAVLALELPDGGGAGVLLTRSGLLVTCHHLVEGWTTARVRLAGGGAGTAGLRRSYRDADLAFLQLDPALLPAVLASLRAPLIGRRIPPGRWPVVGETVLVIGHPMGLEHSLSRGVVSASDRRIDGRRYLQLDASINPGNSGGPVCSERGEWLGIVTCSRIDCEGVSFAIPMPIVYAKLRDYRQERRDHPGPRLYCSVCGHAPPPGRSCEHCGALLALVEADDALSCTAPGAQAEP
jgi:S1-C subfamily serine protease